MVFVRQNSPVVEQVNAIKLVTCTNGIKKEF